jgi:rhodanese-related sulfurtransferase
MNTVNIPQVACRELAALMASNRAHAVFDVRERGEFNACQISRATSLPRSQIEFRIAGLVPNRRLPIVLYDEGGERAIRAARTLLDLGYSDVSILQGGLAGWKEKGLPTASGVNVASKSFGERVHRDRSIPEITPVELKRLQEEGSRLMILDARTPEEYRRFCIPGGVNVPGGDLILWAEELRHKTDTTLVVNCAGRTRGIIGTATLRRLGLDNVRALKNGTMGWVLAGLDLESKPTREVPPPPVTSRERASGLAAQIAKEEGIPWISADELFDPGWSEGTAVTYLIDVRSESEYKAGHAAGSLNIPGGQAVQRADDFIAVRRGRIVFISDEASRAVMAAYWYRGMGFPDVRVLRGGLAEWRKRGGSIVTGEEPDEPLGLDRARKSARLLAPGEADAFLQSSNHVVLDVGSSVDYTAGHLPGATWLSRGWLEIKCADQFPDKSQPILLSCPDGRHSTLAALALSELGYRNVFVLDGGVLAWVRAGFATEAGLTDSLAEPSDVVVSPSVKGDKEEMERYLQWELKLEGE